MLAQVTLKRCPTLKQHDFLKPNDGQYEMSYGESNGHVPDDVT